MTIQTINPATGQLLETYQEMPEKNVIHIVRQADLAFQEWRRVPLTTRVEKMENVIDILSHNKEDVATLMAKEMGKPISAGIAEVEKCMALCEYYCKEIDSLLTPKIVKTNHQKSYVAYEPTGVIFAIMPWNFPLWQVMRFAVPNLLAGNAGLLKHAPICSGTAIAIETLFHDAGFPYDLFRTLVIDVDLASKVIADPYVRGVTLTGSGRAGRAVASEAGKHLKKVVLELGGSDPYVILKDADIDKAAEAIVTSRMSNTGQVCIAAKRIIAVPEIKDALKAAILAKLGRFKMGDPLEEETNFGPMAREDLRDEVHRQVKASVDAGASCLLGGEIPEGDGYYYPPTVLDNVRKGTPAYDEEIFGPVVVFIDAKDEADAILIAKDTTYGLGAAVFTEDLKRGEEIALKELEAGTCCVNTIVKSNPRLPFGGIKDSGFGRELSSEGLHEFMNIKTICVSE